MYRLVLLVVIALASGACTPLGLWIYEEPKVVVTRVQVRFLIGGNIMVERELPTSALFPARNRQTVKIGVASGDLLPGARPRVVAGASQQYFLDGYAILKTPLGERRIPFLRTGVGLSAAELARAS